MIAWSVLTRYTSGRTDLDGCGLADTRADATGEVVNAIRSALMDARAGTAPGEPGPTYTALVDADIALTLHLTRNDLGDLDLDRALDELETFDAADSSSRTAPEQETPA